MKQESIHLLEFWDICWYRIRCYVIHPNTTIWLIKAVSYLVLARDQVQHYVYRDCVFFSQKLYLVRYVLVLGHILYSMGFRPPATATINNTNGCAFSALPSTPEINRTTPDLPCSNLRRRPIQTASPTILRRLLDDTPLIDTPTWAKSHIRQNIFVDVSIRMEEHKSQVPMYPYPSAMRHHSFRTLRIYKAPMPAP